MSQIFDVREHHFDMPEIVANSHPLDDRSKDTLVAQKRLLAKWQMNRNALHDRVRMDPEETSLRQLERVSLLIDSAFANNPFYHELYAKAGYQSGDIATWDDYNALPSITKDDIIDNFEGFVGHLPLSASDCYSARTSGSTGRVLTVIRDEGTYDRYSQLYLRHYEQLLGRARKSEDWLYQIYLKPARRTSLDGQFPAFTLSQDCDVEAAREHLMHLRPAILSAFPSYLLRMLELPDDLSDLGVEVICTNSEGSSKGERARIAERFGVPVLDEYSSEEIDLIATECRHGRYHLVEDNARTDVLMPDANGQGEIVVTGLMSSYTPFIRYRQGDVIELGHEELPCACGSRFRTLAKFHGRADQFLTRHDGSIVAPYSFMGLYDRTLISKAARVSEFQVVQQSVDRVDLLVRLAPGERTPGAEMMNEFVRGLQELFGDTPPEVVVQIVDEMPKGLSHKRRVITNRIPTSEH